MKASKCFWVALCLLVGNFSTELWAQKNLEAVVQKCKADKTIDKSVVTNKDPKTKKVYKIVSSFVVEGHAALQQEIKSAFERDKEEAYQVIENENDGVLLLTYLHSKTYMSLLDLISISFSSGMSKFSMTVKRSSSSSTFIE